jgi:uncharacterized protein (UPF0548 family)
VFRLTRPSEQEIAAFLKAEGDAPFSYAEVGASGGALPPGYTVDHNRVLLGRGAEVFEAAVAALRAWRMARLGWAAIHPADAPQAPGRVVAMVVRHYGFWSLHACRIVYAVDREEPGAAGAARRVGFAYGTLPAHAARGEERFSVEWHRPTDEVWYDLLAFSRPRHPLARLGYPLGRLQQRRFGRDSKAAMVAAVGMTGVGGLVT